MSLYANTSARLIGSVLLAITSSLALSASGDESGTEVIVREIAKTAVTAGGEPVNYPRTDKPEVTANVVELPPGAETGWHYHPIPVYGYVIRGTLEVERETGEVITYRQGDAIVEAMDSLLNARNTGMEPVEMVAFYMGAQGIANTVTTPEAEEPGSG
ncbi:cupin domain-containing protein [Thiohalomonas denitrificans]|uniref:Cupin domain-containing protein n=1 Tax=Thiohalomonas denitrificans TaxID=415747 RepID=A0A1G5QN31_9GAMM|nr:cupin domain-containing protein [Thiohalomonas denitrificans]SCZ63142.1 Cupin domain-containing protein [Thiohalomonas denitrificans]